MFFLLGGGDMRGLGISVGVARCVAGAMAFLVLLFVPVLSGARAETGSDPLLVEFDARPFSAEEKRVLQIGLTVSGTYRGLIDGAWGARSQQAMEAFVAETDADAAATGLVFGYHAAEIGRRAYDFLSQTGLAYRGGPPVAHRLLAPAGDFVPGELSDWGEFVLKGRDVELRVFQTAPGLAAILHKVMLDGLPAYAEPYTVRRSGRLVTALEEGGVRWYVRSDPDPMRPGAWDTTMVVLQPGGDRRVFEVVVGSLSSDPGAEVLGNDVRLTGLVRAWLAVGDEDAPAAPEAVTAAAPERGDSGGLHPLRGTGTGFFVNNTDLVTARHVVEECRAVTLLDGTALSIVAVHPGLDLALLSSPARSRDWIPVHRTGKAALGQPVIALGYPYFGQVNTALNSTLGNVSALVGYHDDPDAITVSAPIQPGNSGGPLLSSDGTVIGVVVAQIAKIEFAEENGSLPENINYAVTGEALLGFLEAEGASLPRLSGEGTDLREGVPETVQRAVVPVLCEG